MRDQFLRHGRIVTFVRCTLGCLCKIRKWNYDAAGTLSATKEEEVDSSNCCFFFFERLERVHVLVLLVHNKPPPFTFRFALLRRDENGAFPVLYLNIRGHHAEPLLQDLPIGGKQGDGQKSAHLH